MLGILKDGTVTMVQGWLSLSKKIVIETVLSWIQRLLGYLGSFQYYFHALLEILHLLFEVRNLRIKFLDSPLVLNLSFHQLISVLHSLMKHTRSCGVWDLYHRLGVIMQGWWCIWLIIVSGRQYILLALSLLSKGILVHEIYFKEVISSDLSLWVRIFIWVPPPLSEYPKRNGDLVESLNPSKCFSSTRSPAAF